MSEELLAQLARQGVAMAELVAALALADPWLTKDEAVAYTRRSARTLERAVAASELEAGGTPGKRAYRRSALDLWLSHGPVVALCLAQAAGLDLDLDFDL